MGKVTTIVASKWHCASPQATQLINNGINGDAHCCLGFDALAWGISEEEIGDNGEPGEFVNDSMQECTTKMINYAEAWTQKSTQDLRRKIPIGMQHSSVKIVNRPTLQTLAISVNDSKEDITKRRRFEILKPIFAAAGRILRFKDDED